MDRETSGERPSLPLAASGTFSRAWRFLTHFVDHGWNGDVCAKKMTRVLIDSGHQIIRLTPQFAKQRSAENF